MEKRCMRYFILQKNKEKFLKTYSHMQNRRTAVKSRGLKMKNEKSLRKTRLIEKIKIKKRRILQNNDE